MTKLERAAMQQALEALTALNAATLWTNNVTESWNAREAITALREALAEQAEQEPVGYWQGTFSTEGGAILYEVPQVSAFGYPYPNHPVYAAPVRTKDLTDDEIMDLVRDECVDMRWPSTPLFIARAVIAADREKNK